MEAAQKETRNECVNGDSGVVFLPVGLSGWQQLLQAEPADRLVPPKSRSRIHAGNWRWVSIRHLFVHLVYIILHSQKMSSLPLLIAHGFNL